MGIVDEISSHKRKRGWLKFVIIILLLVLIGYGYSSYTKSKQSINPSYKTYTVDTGSILISVNADGKVLYKEYYNLNFPISGTIKSINKKQGDKVISGELIATLDDTYLNISYDKAKISLDNAYANLNSKLASKSSKADINISEEQIGSSIASYDVTKTDVESNIENLKKSLEKEQENLKSLKNEYNNLLSTQKVDLKNSDQNLVNTKIQLENTKNNLERTKITEQEKLDNLNEKGFLAIESLLVYIDKYIKESDNILGVTDSAKNKNDSFEQYLGVKDITTKYSAENKFSKTFSSYNNFNLEWNTYKLSKNYSNITGYLDKINDIGQSTVDLLEGVLKVLKNTVSSTSFTETIIDNYVSNFESYISTLKGNIQTLVSAKQTINEQQISMKTKIDSLNDSISDLENKVELAQTSIEKTNVNNSSSLDSLSGKILVAQKQYESAKLQYDSAVKKAQKNLELSQKQIDISKANLNLKKEGFTKEELAPYYVAIESAKKNLQEAQRKITDSVLKSPVNGVVGNINGNVGETTIATGPFVTITEDAGLYIESYVEELDISKIKINQPVYIHVDALDKTLTGYVTYISNISKTDSNSIVTYKVEIKFDGLNSGIREGMSVDIDYVIDESKSYLKVPLESINNQSGAIMVFSLDDNKLKQIFTGISDGKFVSVLSGLKLGEKIKY